MVKSKLRYFTYKITFKDLPKYFYFGRHKDVGKPYFGSPVTWKHLWDQFEPEIQILQWYESEEEVIKNEYAIIEATWKSQYSLNEHNGGGFSEEARCRGGKTSGCTNVEKRKGIFNPEYSQSTKFIEDKRKNGTKSYEEKYGLFDPNFLQSAKRKESSSKVGKDNVSMGRGIFDPDYLGSEEYKETRISSGRKASKITNSQKWRCLETGFITNPGNLTQYQRARGIDTSRRERII
jgi:hypothetical protein